ncbi:hypothetical protein [Rhizobium lentis]|uniref:hypothetical protein n=1 Tax=Rhizobium lentis TaxID=1138194 RepID=UPI001A90F241|nr:hypothetical protein [Rhizobium lentis]MBX5069073.1 hypothetical protein [Rhizobium lentis]MBX5080150.1 hypothetical protein [Rhizobium lentis]QSW96010.1 hypothetical protein J0663_24875 [Rhizobium lentis]
MDMNNLLAWDQQKRQHTQPVLGGHHSTESVCGRTFRLVSNPARYVLCEIFDRDPAFTEDVSKVEA